MVAQVDAILFIDFFRYKRMRRQSVSPQLHLSRLGGRVQVRVPRQVEGPALQQVQVPLRRLHLSKWRHLSGQRTRF